MKNKRQLAKFLHERIKDFNSDVLYEDLIVWLVDFEEEFEESEHSQEENSKVHHSGANPNLVEDITPDTKLKESKIADELNKDYEDEK